MKTKYLIANLLTGLFWVAVFSFAAAVCFAVEHLLRNF